MKSKLATSLIALLAVLSTACASGQKYEDVVDRIPPVPADHGRIIFYRTSIAGAAVKPKVQLNDEVVGKATALAFFYEDRPPGDYVVSCSTEEEHRLSFTLAVDQVRYVKLIMQMGLFVGHVRPELVDEEQAGKDLGSTKYTGDESRLVPLAAPEP